MNCSPVLLLATQVQTRKDSAQNISIDIEYENKTNGAYRQTGENKETGEGQEKGAFISFIYCTDWPSRSQNLYSLASICRQLLGCPLAVLSPN